MTAQFKVDDVAIIKFCNSYPEFAGTEVTITGPLRECGWGLGEMWVGYDTDLVLPNGYKFCPEPHQLRRKPPKQSTDAWATEQVAKVTKPVAQPVTEEVA